MKQVSVCPRCGAPVFMPEEWADPNTPPMVSYSCTCVADQKKQMEEMQKMRPQMMGGPMGGPQGRPMPPGVAFPPPIQPAKP